MKNNFLLLIIISLLVLPFASSIGCDAQGWKGYSKLYDNKTVTITCPTCNYINFSAVNPQGLEFLSNVGMVKNGAIFTYTFLGQDLDLVGTYNVDGYSQLDEPLAFCFDVTISGNQNSVSTYIALSFILLLFLVGIIWLNVYINDKKRDQLYNKIVNNALGGTHGTNRNIGMAIMYGVVYGILKMYIMVYYLWGVAFLFLLTEFISAMGVNSLVLIITTLLNVFLWGFILVFIIMIFVFYGIFREVLSDIDKGMRGFFNGK